METATKAALFSALLFPGWGQIYLKRYKRGIAIITLTLAGMLSICWGVVQVAISILKAAPFKKGTVAMSAVVKLSLDSVKALDSIYFSLILLFIVLLWIFSIVDAYHLGKKQMPEITISVNQL
jgi:TM2 domain-containing membrane protein YozV